MGITKQIVSAAVEEANILHVESWGDGHSFSSNLNQIISEHRYLAAFGIVARELGQFQVLTPKCSIAPEDDEEEGAA